MKRFFAFAILVLILALARSASANTLTMTSQILAANGDGGGFSGTLNGSTVVDVYCVDFTDFFWYGETYDVNVTSIPPSSTAFMQQTRLGAYSGAFEYFNGTYTVLQRYEMAGYLSTQYATAGTQTAINEIQNAIWSLLATYGSAAPYGCDSACQSDITHAFGQLPTFLASNIVNVYTIAPPNGTPANQFGCTSYGSGDGIPILSGGNCMQEFVSVTDPPPEPSTLALMGIGGGLIGLGTLRRRRVARN